MRAPHATGLFICTSQPPCLWVIMRVCIPLHLRAQMLPGSSMAETDQPHLLRLLQGGGREGRRGGGGGGGVGSRGPRAGLLQMRGENCDLMQTWCCPDRVLLGMPHAQMSFSPGHNPGLEAGRASSRCNLRHKSDVQAVRRQAYERD